MLGEVAGKCRLQMDEATVHFDKGSSIQSESAKSPTMDAAVTLVSSDQAQVTPLAV